MSRIDELIRELCPEGVTYRALGEIGELVRGNGMPKTDFTESGVGAIHYGQIYTYYGTWTTETISCVSRETAARLAKVDPGDVIITNTSENLEDVGKAVAWLGDEQIVTGGHATVFKHSQDAKFIAYWLQTPEFFVQKKRLASGTKVIDVSAKSLGKVRIPVPPLEVQREIVRVLDLFTSLEAELEAELEARRRQYAHYRDSLLTFPEGGVRWIPMGELADLNWGNTETTKQSYVTEGERWPAFSASGQDGFLPFHDFDRPAVVLSAIGAQAGKTWRTSGKWSCIKNTIRFFSRDESVVTTDYLYWITSRAGVFPRRGSAQPFISKGDADAVLIPVPPLEEQARIVAILDAFDSLVNDLSVGLPAELAARRKQYEHYRDRLLTFKEAAA